MISDRFLEKLQPKRVTRETLRPIRESAKRIYCCKCCRYIGNKYGEKDADFDRNHFKIDPYPRNTENLTGERYGKYLCPFCEEQYKKHQNWKGTNHDFDEDTKVKNVFTENILGVNKYKKHFKEDLTLFDKELGVDENYNVWKYVDQDTLRKTFNLIDIIRNDTNENNIEDYENIQECLDDMEKGLEIIADSYDIPTLKQGFDLFNIGVEFCFDFDNESDPFDIDKYVREWYHYIATDDYSTYKYIFDDELNYNHYKVQQIDKLVEKLSKDRKIINELGRLLLLRQEMLIWYKAQLQIKEDRKR